MYWYFGTEQGSAIRATGSNPNMSRAQGINTDNMKLIGLALSNGMVALSGGLMAQYQGFADVNMGRGSIVIGLAAIIIGEVLCDAAFRKGCEFYMRLLFVIVGGIVYYIVMVIILWLKLDPNDLKLFTAISSQERSGPASAGRPGNDPYDAGGTARASTGAPAGTGAAGRHAS